MSICHAPAEAQSDGDNDEHDVHGNPCVAVSECTGGHRLAVPRLRVHAPMVVPNDRGGVIHAQLTLGGGMIMLGSVMDTEFGKLMTQPDEIGGVETQSSYLVVPDADAVYARAKTAGGEIVREIRDEEYGGRGFACRDLEKHLWSVGTYDPWTEPAS